MKIYQKCVALPLSDAPKIEGWLEAEGLFVKRRPLPPPRPPASTTLMQLICDNFDGQAIVGVSASSFPSYVLVRVHRWGLEVEKEVFDEELIDQIDECLRAHGGFDPTLLRSLHERQ